LHVADERVTQADARLDAAGVALEHLEARATLGDVVVHGDAVGAVEIQRLAVDLDVDGRVGPAAAAADVLQALPRGVALAALLGAAVRAAVVRIAGDAQIVDLHLGAVHGEARPGDLRLADAAALGGA